MPSIKFTKSIISAVLLASTLAFAAPAGTSVLSAPEATQTAPYAEDNPNNMLWTPHDKVTPEPIRGALGATVLGPHNIPAALQNADLLAPPSTDSGSVSVSLSFPPQ